MGGEITFFIVSSSFLKSIVFMFYVHVKKKKNLQTAGAWVDLYRKTPPAVNAFFWVRFFIDKKRTRR